MPHRVMHRRAKLALICTVLAASTVPGCLAGTQAAQREQACLALMPVSQLPSMADRAYAGEAPAFDALRRALPGLEDEALYVTRPELLPLKEHIGVDVRVLLTHQNALVQARQAMRLLYRDSATLLEDVQEFHVQQLAADASLPELTATTQLAMLSQRLGKSAAGFFGARSVDPEAAFLLGKDVKVFQELLTGLKDGNTDLRLRAAGAGPLRDRLLKLQKDFDAVRPYVGPVLGNPRPLIAAVEARARLSNDAAALDNALSDECARAGTERADTAR